MALRLTMGFSDNPRVQPLKDGLVKPQGIELDCITLDPSNLFQRNLTYDEFDVSEMSISETLLARERTDGKKWDWSALPVFLVLSFVVVAFEDSGRYIRIQSSGSGGLALSRNSTVANTRSVSPTFSRS